ncbi:MAG: FecCD family ABC transporter permease [Fimbriimonas sp.]
MKSRAPLLIALLAAGVLAALVLHVALGSSLRYPPLTVLQEILRGSQGGNGSTENGVVWDIRLPRALAAVLVGGILGIVGSAFQAQFRNPLAEPYVVGVSSGAAVGGVVSLLLKLPEPFGTMGLGFAGGMLSLGLVWGLARRNGVVDVSTLLLAGVVVGALLSALMSLGLLLAGQNANQLVYWLMGHLHDVNWLNIRVLGISFGVGAILLIRESRRLNAVAMGEEAAARLGVDVARVRLIVLTVGTAMSAVAVGAVGIIGFLGLVAPHLARRIFGVDWRWSLLGSAVLGALLLTLADIATMRGLNTITETVGLEPPVGFVTALLGAPSLLALLRKQN